MRNSDLFVAFFMSVFCIVLNVIYLFQHLNDSERNDLCVKAGGIYVNTYDEYKCYSTDFRQELKIGFNNGN